ncbi:hypothetical protein EVAR_75470_1 [Eumeta japonica]|uniref:Uncharacterized protein n=1 Tax=Eumeta variegata TaxID=151549 RepID=A0A4C1TN60_EUMVA|nr:hypothetical protein EVAR_75470_1 [Eumeta japonica]
MVDPLSRQTSKHRAWTRLDAPYLRDSGSSGSAVLCSRKDVRRQGEKHLLVPDTESYDCHGRKRIKASEQINDGARIPATEATEAKHVILSISTLDCIDIDYLRTPIIKDIFSSS